MIFTTSWDDGRKDDLRLAELLEKYGATGTFYISPPDTHEKPALSDSDIKMLSEKHEVGAHTITHPRLTRVSLEQARTEIEESKKWIESVTGKPCTMFCYPAGDENPEVRSLVRSAGFRGARGVEQLEFATKDEFCLPTTLQVYPFPLRRKYTNRWHLLDPVARLRMFYPQMRSFRLPLRASLSWLNLAKELFSYADKSNQPYFHLWGHSWEIEKYGMWGHLEKFLKYVSDQENVVYSTNTDLL